MKITIVIPYDPRYQPFAVRSLMFAGVLTRRGHTVTLFYRPRPVGKRGRQVHREPFGPFKTVCLRWADGSSWVALERAIAESDVVHFQKSDPLCTVAALSLARRHGKAVHQDWDDDDFAFCIETLTDAVASDGPFGERLRRALKGAVGASVVGLLEWSIPKLVDTMGAASICLRSRSASWGCDPGAVFPARVGVDADLFAPDRRDAQLRAKHGLRGPTLHYSGHFDVHRDLRFFVDTMRLLVARVPEAQCLVVGGGSGRGRLLRLIEQAGLSRSVVVTDGFVPHHEMPRHVACCDIAVLPMPDTARNRSKSSLTLLECMASGLAVVTQDVGDMAWMLGDCGVIAAADAGPSDLAAAAVVLARDGLRRAELGRRARARSVELFSWNRTVDHLEAAYRVAIARNRGGAPGPAVPGRGR